MANTEKIALLKITDGHCAYCGKELDQVSDSGWHMDHVTPRSQGGRWKGNLIPSCPTCNLRKQGHDPEQFRQWIRRHAIKHIRPDFIDELDRLAPFLANEDARRLADLMNELLDFIGDVPIHFYMDDKE